MQDLLPANRATIGKCKVHQSCRRGSSNQIFQECRSDYLITFGPQFVNYIPPFGAIGQTGFGLSNEHSYQFHQNSSQPLFESFNENPVFAFDYLNSFTATRQTFHLFLSSYLSLFLYSLVYIVLPVPVLVFIFV